MRRRPLVAIVGRPNVGKSTLFNRIIGERRAVVHPLPGMTRDRHYADAEYRGRPFTVIDTGGYEDSAESRMLQQMRQQSLIAIEESDVVIFLTAANEPNDPTDAEIIEKLRASGRPFFLVVNKTEGGMREAQAYADFSCYGLDRVYPISALHGENVFDLLDDLTAGFAAWDPELEDLESGVVRVALVGRQNVGKSTLLNRLFGEERVIANPEAGTTRDAIDAELTVNGKPFVLIDTAGIRRRGRIERGPEALSVHSSFRAIDRAHVAILLLDMSEGITAQDTHIAGYILERRKACLILLNKWDKVKDKEKRYGDIIQEVRREFCFMPWAPIMTVSALTGQRTHRIWDLIDLCAENFRKEFSTREINLILKKATAYLSPPTHRGNAITLKYAVQTRTQPPTITFFVNDERFLHFSYKRYLKNQFQMQLGLEGTPLVFRFRRKSPPRGWEKASRSHSSERETIRHDEDALPQDRAFFAGIYDDQMNRHNDDFGMEVVFDEDAFDDEDDDTEGED